MKSKKGFTVVELVIVIAIIAILATALIPTFGGLIGKANLTKDQQAVRNMNMDLIVAMAEGKLNSAGDAITALGGEGFYGDKLIPFNEGYHYAYDAKQKMMYLLDKSGAPVFPDDKAQAEDLWGLYGDYNSDYISGITHYVATKAITNAEYFKVFDNGTYTIDLNKNVITVASTNAANITLLNGTYTTGDYASSGDSAQKMDTFDTSSGTVNTAEIKNAVIDLGAQTHFTGANDDNVIIVENCVFMGNTADPRITVSSGTTLIIRNCVFINSDKWSLMFYWSAGDVQILNNEFVNCARGINFEGVSGNIVIEGNTFNLRGASNAKNNAIQLANTSATYEIKNNNFVSATAAVVVHCGYIQQNHSANLEFANNTYGENVKGVIADPDYQEPSSNMTAEQQKAMEDAVAAFNAAVK